MAQIILTEMMQKQPGQFSFTKYSTSSAKLQGAVFTLSNDTVTLTATSGENGLVSFSNIASGTYILAEKTAQ